jgi:peptide/nickel transport system permease protein
LRIIRKHLLPSFFSYLIVNVTLAVPAMILGETALSYLGLGLRQPVISWGVLLQLAQSVQVIHSYPWLMWPGAFVIVVVLAFNFIGDGLRDAADPYVR